MSRVWDAGRLGQNLSCRVALRVLNQGGEGGFPSLSISGSKLLFLPQSFGLTRERDLYRQRTGPSPLNYRDDFSRPALRHGSLNSHFQVAVYLPSQV